MRFWPVMGVPPGKKPSQKGESTQGVDTKEPTIPNQATSELDQAQIVLTLLGVADQDGAATVEPAQGAFDDPAARLAVGVLVLDGHLLLADAADVRGVAGRA